MCDGYIKTNDCPFKECQSIKKYPNKPDFVILTFIVRTAIIYLSCLPPSKKRATFFPIAIGNRGICDIATHKVCPTDLLLRRYVRSYRTISPLPTKALPDRQAGLAQVGFTHILAKF